MVNDLKEHFGRTEQHACDLAGISRSCYRYRPRPPTDNELRQRLKELAEQKKRYGARRLHVLVKKEGLVINHKRTERIYREEHLALRRKSRKKLPSGVRVPLPQPTLPNEQWSIDFIHDMTATSRRFRCLTVLDLFTRECLSIRVDTSISGKAVIDTLQRQLELRGKPQTIVLDNGPEFTSGVFQSWAEGKAIHPAYIRPGKPMDNAFIESFQGKFRDECLNQHWFKNLPEARQIIEQWRQEYNRERPHSSLGDLTPIEFAERATA